MTESQTEAAPATNPASSSRTEQRAAAKARRRIAMRRREDLFDLLATGYTHRQIAKAMKISVASVRRAIDTAIKERRLDAPDRFVHLQVARLNRALAHADLHMARGNIQAFAPFMKVLAALDRYHGLDAPYQRLPPAPRPAIAAPTPPLALTHDPAPALPPVDAKVAESGA